MAVTMLRAVALGRSAGLGCQQADADRVSLWGSITAYKPLNCGFA